MPLIPILARRRSICCPSAAHLPSMALHLVVSEDARTQAPLRLCRCRKSHLNFHLLCSAAMPSQCTTPANDAGCSISAFDRSGTDGRTRCVCGPALVSFNLQPHPTLSAHHPYLLVLVVLTRPPPPPSPFCLLQPWCEMMPDEPRNVVPHPDPNQRLVIVPARHSTAEASAPAPSMAIRP